MAVLQVQWLHPDGVGGGRTSAGAALRLAGAVPGDTAGWVHGPKPGTGRPTALLHPAPTRRAPPCPWSRCGGCDLGHLEPGARRAALAHVVGRALGVPPPDVVSGPRTTRWRARIKLAVEGGRVGFRAPRSRQLVEIGSCGVARPELQAALTRLRRAARRAGGSCSVELRSDGARAVACLEGRARPLVEALELPDVALGGRAVRGRPALDLTVGEHVLRASPRSFFQVHPEVNEALVSFVCSAVLEAAPERVLDLYAGIGNFSVPVAASGVPVAAVELEGQAARDLRHNARGLPVEVHAAAAERLDTSRIPFDVVVLDPPRAGAARVLERVLLHRPRRLVYVSCHIVSCARDLRPALRAGYRIDRVLGFDMFPDTHHLEAAVVLERS